MWKVAHSRRFSSIHSAVCAKTFLRSWSNPTTKDSVHLDAVVVQHAPHGTHTPTFFGVFFFASPIDFGRIAIRNR